MREEEHLHATPRGGGAGPTRRRSALVLVTAVFWLAVAWSAVRPYHLVDYLLEILTPVGGFFLLWFTRRRFPFTTLSYALMCLEGLVLVVGAHYTHERVPLFDWLRDALGHERNHYDRFAHFCVGFLMVIPVREFLGRLTPLRGRWLATMSVVSILAWGSFYEITEWWIAAVASPETGAAYLGAQGDPWDAQKDMLLDGLGAVAGLVALGRIHRSELRRFLDSGRGSLMTIAQPGRP